MSHVEMLSKLSGPVYLGENNRSNSLNVILKNAEIFKQLAGPLYVKENSKHAFVEVMTRLRRPLRDLFRSREKAKLCSMNSRSMQTASRVSLHQFTSQMSRSIPLLRSLSKWKVTRILWVLSTPLMALNATLTRLSNF